MSAVLLSRADSGQSDAADAGSAVVMRKAPDEKVTTRRCREIVEAIVKRCDSPDVNKCEVAVGFTRDWGGNSLTMLIDGGHADVGDPEYPFWVLVEELHAMLTSGFGLSVHREEKAVG